MDVNGNWLWAAKAGGSSSVISYGITLDNTGNSYVTGIFLHTATFGAYSLTSSGYVNIFVAKMDTDGNWLWVNQAGGNGWDGGFGITIDDAGNNYVTGSFKGTVYFGLYPLYSSGFDDIFVAKIDENGNWLWATQAGGSSSNDSGYGITVHNTRNCYVTGNFMYTATFGSYSLTSNGSEDIFVAKMDAVGNWLWATQAGAGSDDSGYEITIDNAGNCYVTGNFRETATFGSHSLTSSGENDIFVAKLNSSVYAENEIIPTEIRLSNYPNPFNPTTTISFSIPAESHTEISIYNIKGQKIKTLISNQLSAGEHSVVWDGKDDYGNKVSSGVYLYKLKAGDFQRVRKMILLK
ncbi:MAG: SBBP repeat-containing protein [Armatimonadetes bacterium]|nr:SBBP repeat-containing protein [Armatimonadota bacterium]